MPSYSSDRKWQIIGWINRLEYLAGIDNRGWQIRYIDTARVIIRIPPRVGQSEAWHVLDKVPGCTTGDHWLAIPRSKSVLRELLTEQFGLEAARVIVDNIRPVTED